MILADFIAFMDGSVWPLCGSILGSRQLAMVGKERMKREREREREREGMCVDYI